MIRMSQGPLFAGLSIYSGNQVLDNETFAGEYATLVDLSDHAFVDSHSSRLEESNSDFPRWNNCDHLKASGTMVPGKPLVQKSKWTHFPRSQTTYTNGTVVKFDVCISIGESRRWKAPYYMADWGRKVSRYPFKGSELQELCFIMQWLGRTLAITHWSQNDSLSSSASISTTLYEFGDLYDYKDHKRFKCRVLVANDNFVGNRADTEGKAEWLNRYYLVTYPNLKTNTYTRDAYFPQINPVRIDPWQVVLASEEQIFASLPKPKWSELASTAYSSVDFFTGNGIAGLSDCKELKASAQSTLQTIRGLASSHRIKAISQLYLSFHYGWKLFALDLKDLVQSFKDLAALSSNERKCTASSTWNDGKASVTYRYHAYYDFMGQLTSDAERLSYLLDFRLNLGNIWDMIPYSFCIDWFVSIGDVAESLDSWYDMRQVHKFICSCKSSKATAIVTGRDLGNPGWCGSVVVTRYSRHYSREFVSPSLSLSFNPTGPLDHIVEAGALIVSRR